MTTGFDNGTNSGRVSKIVEIVELLKKSAESNKASAQEIIEVLKPAIQAIESMVSTKQVSQQNLPLTSTRQSGSAAATKSAYKGLPAGQRAALMLADQASLRELVVSLIARLESFEEQLQPRESEQQ